MQRHGIRYRIAERLIKAITQMEGVPYDFNMTADRYTLIVQERDKPAKLIRSVAVR